MTLFAATPQAQSAIDLLNNANNWSQAVSNSLNGKWNTLITPSSPLWQAVCGIATGILLLVLLPYVVIFLIGLFRNGTADFAPLAQRLFVQIAIPLVMSLFLLNNGAGLATGVKMFRSISLGAIDTATKINIGSLNVQQALKQVSASSGGTSAIQAIVATCNGKTGAEYADCLTAIEPQINQTVAAFEAKAGSALPSLQNMASSIAQTANSVIPLGSAIQFVSDAPTNFLKFLLLVIQSCVLMCLELALILMAVSSPIFLVLAFIPGRFSFATSWFKKYLELFGFKFAYFIVIGLAAMVIVDGSVFTGPIDIIFLALIALFGPWLARQIARADGQGAFSGLTGAAATAVGTAARAGAAVVTGGASTAGQVAAKQAAKKLVNK